ncbi:TPA: hypothetical protein L4935_000301 [Pseudomonas aeruginosa]|uniref:hypothetical protein n=1 Tax=Pseudomonas paraeruginosa TaxID=2994495 RepID=UPI00374A6D0A|nr:hypothetical protein [Pseudomonas aeruginosa]
MDLYAAVDRRAQLALNVTAQRFSAYLRSCSDEAPVGFENRLAAERLRLEQTLSSKLFGRIYTCWWRWTTPADFGERDMRIALRFKGWRRAHRRAVFVGAPGFACDIFNASDVVLQLCAALDIGGLAIDYRAAQRRCRLSLRPNYGDYIWLLIPPVKYVRQPNAAEVDSTALLIHELSRLCRRGAAPPMPG